MADQDKPPLMFPINSPRLRRLEAWLWQRPKTSIALTLISIGLISSPAWFSDVWALFSNNAPVPAIMNWVSQLPAMNFSWYWLPVGLGSIMLIVITTVLWRGRKRLESEVASARAKAEQRKPTAVQPESVELKINDSLHGCPDTWLHDIADGQVKRVWEFVEVTATNVWQNRESNLEAAIPAIYWGIALKNNSVFPVSLDGDIKGYLFFEGHKLGEQRFEAANWLKNLGHLDEGRITFEQRLSKLEADLIKSKPKGKFTFQELRIHIKGGQGFDEISSHRLIVPDNFNVGLDQISDKTTQAVAQEIEPLTEERDSLKARLEELSPLAGDLMIESGLYGVPGIHQEDVTAILAKMVTNNTLSLDGYYNDFLPDRVQTKRKQLHISYTHNGVSFSVTVPENRKITLPIAYRGPLRGLPVRR
jgi:hypothetical protein